MSGMVFPAVVRHVNDPELSYLESADALLEMERIELDDTDLIIDSEGQTYRVGQDDGKMTYLPTKITSLNDFLGLVKAHAANRGSCCVAKLYAPDYAEAFKIIASFEHE